MNSKTAGDEAVTITISNLLWAGVLLLPEVSNQMVLLQQCDDISLDMRLVESRRLVNMSLEVAAQRYKN